MNYFDIIRSYNELKIAKRVGAKANSLFYAIIGKANTLRYPAKFTIFNSELMDLSGLSKDELHPARNKLTQITINDQFIVKYHKKGTRKPGVYEINYKGFEHFFQNESSYWLEDCSENTTNDNTNSYTNHSTNNPTNDETLVGKSDTLLTKQNITKDIVEYLNEKTNKKFNPKTKKTKELISGRLTDGYTVEDFKYVIDVKVNHWMEDQHMKQYLRPTTLFAPSKFEEYLNQDKIIKLDEQKRERPKEREVEFEELDILGGMGYGS